MTEKENLLKEMAEYKPEIISDDEESYNLPALKGSSQVALTDIEYQVIGDHVSSVSREEILNKYGLKKSELNAILRKQKAKDLIKELSSEKHEAMKSRLVGVLNEQTEDMIELIEQKKAGGESPEKLNFMVFGTSSLIDIYEKLGKMSKDEVQDAGNNVLNFLANEISINRDS